MNAVKTKKIINKALIYLILSIVGVFLIFPYVFMVNRSFMTSRETMIFPIAFWPDSINLNSFVTLFKQDNYFIYLLNTLKIVVINVIAVPLSASLCAYSFARVKYKGKEVVFGLVMATMMIPGTITQIPLYVLFANLGWLETALPMTVPAFFGGGAVNIFLLRQFMRSVPYELENAAKIDGANMFTRYLKIMLPLCMPILLYVAVASFGACWSDFYGPLLYLKQRSSYTLAIAIYYDSITSSSSLEKANLRMAAGVFMSLFPALLFLVYQRKLVDGIMIGGVKG